MGVMGNTCIGVVLEFGAVLKAEVERNTRVGVAMRISVEVGERVKVTSCAMPSVGVSSREP